MPAWTQVGDKRRAHIGRVLRRGKKARREQAAVQQAKLTDIDEMIRPFAGNADREQSRIHKFCDARRLVDVPAAIREAADLVIDAGELPGTRSTVIDLRRFEADGAWEIARRGAVASEVVADAVAATS